MSPILDSIGSTKAYGWGASPGFSLVGSYDSIATTTVGAGGASSITFSSIPSTYTHLQIRGISRSSSANNYDNLWISFNSNYSGYSSHYLAGNGATADAFAWTSDSYIRSFYTSGGASTSGVFAASVIDILDYANTSKYKTTRQLNGFDNNGTGTSSYDKGLVDLSSGLWQNTSAISSINLIINGGVNFVTGSQFALYGIKGN